MLLVLFLQLRKDKDIIKIDNAEIINVALEGAINVGLEGCRGIYKAKGHDKIFKMAISGMKCRLLFISFTYLNAIIYILKVNFGEDNGTIKLVKELIN